MNQSDAKSDADSLLILLNSKGVINPSSRSWHETGQQSTLVTHVFWGQFVCRNTFARAFGDESVMTGLSMVRQICYPSMHDMLRNEYIPARLPRSADHIKKRVCLGVLRNAGRLPARKIKIIVLQSNSELL